MHCVGYLLLYSFRDLIQNRQSLMKAKCAPVHQLVELAPLHTNPLDHDSGGALFLHYLLLSVLFCWSTLIHCIVVVSQGCWCVILLIPAQT